LEAAEGFHRADLKVSRLPELRQVGASVEGQVTVTMGVVTIPTQPASVRRVKNAVVRMCQHIFLSEAFIEKDLAHVQPRIEAPDLRVVLAVNKLLDTLHECHREAMRIKDVFYPIGKKRDLGEVPVSLRARSVLDHARNVQSVVFYTCFFRLSAYFFATSRNAASSRCAKFPLAAIRTRGESCRMGR
jgi:hypothetical protein